MIGSPFSNAKCAVIKHSKQAHTSAAYAHIIIHMQHTKSTEVCALCRMLTTLALIHVTYLLLLGSVREARPDPR